MPGLGGAKECDSFPQPPSKACLPTPDYEPLWRMRILLRGEKESKVLLACLHFKQRATPLDRSIIILRIIYHLWE